MKRLLFEVGYMLVGIYLPYIALTDEYFYLTLAESIQNIEKYD